MLRMMERRIIQKKKIQVDMNKGIECTKELNLLIDVIKFSVILFFIIVFLEIFHVHVLFMTSN